MKSKALKTTFRISTGLLSVIVIMFVGNSLFNRTVFAERFTSLGYPSYLIYPLAIANVAGLIAIWSNKSRLLTDLAYAGFFFNFLLAFAAEWNAADGEILSSTLALAFVTTSYLSRRKQIEQKLSAS
jgi:hypothetical protein